MNRSISFPPYFKLACLSLTFLVAGISACQSTDGKTASVEKKAEAPKPAPQKSKPDSTMKFANGPKMLGVSCCKGMPSRAKALAAKK
jgi:hypothetical protein